MSNWKKAQPIIQWRRAVGFTLPSSLTKWLQKECHKAKTNKIKANKTLAGHLKEEYFLKNISKEFKDFILKYCLNHPDIQIQTSKLSILSNNRPFYIKNLWVNFQKKYEFNPPHNHSGIYSFVIFVKIPYKLKQEEEYFKDLEVNNLHNKFIHTSKFAFLNIDYTGEIRCDLLDVDDSFEGKMIMFPAKQSHQVFPFYTSNGYRVTVSGNIGFEVNNVS